MNLPPLEWQIVYGRLAWAVVLGAVLLGGAGWRTRPSRTAFATVMLLMLGVLAMPGGASPIYWLGLAFQWPSAMCVALCVLSLHGQWHGNRLPLLPPALATVAALAGGLLYLDASGWIAVGLYFMGFSRQGGPLIALALGFLCVVAIARSEWRRQAAAVLAALLTYILLRLPTGNLWDALLDPFVWIWSLVVLIRRAWAVLRRSRSQTAPEAIQAS